MPHEGEDAITREARTVAHRFAPHAQRHPGTLSMIQRVFAEHGLPDALGYMAIIESSLNPDATSPVGARGLWQIMPATGRDLGLSKRDLTHPARSTHAAARYLAHLHERLGDWQLAAAAYNAGVGRVLRLVRRYEQRHGTTPTYWDLRAELPQETRSYVPRLIALVRHLEMA